MFVLGTLSAINSWDSKDILVQPLYSTDFTVRTNNDLRLNNFSHVKKKKYVNYPWKKQYKHQNWDISLEKCMNLTK